MQGTSNVKLTLVLLWCQQCVYWWFCYNVSLIATRPRLGQSDDWLAAEERDFLLVQNLQTISRAHTDPYSRVLGFFVRGKMARA